MPMPPASDDELVSRDEIVEGVDENRLSWLTTEPVDWEGTHEGARVCIDKIECNDELNPVGIAIIEDGEMPFWGEIKDFFQGPDADPAAPGLTDTSFCGGVDNDVWVAQTEVDHGGADFTDPDVDAVQVWRAEDDGGSPGTFSLRTTQAPANFPITDSGIAGTKYYYRLIFERHIDDAGDPVERGPGPNASITLQDADPGCTSS